LPSLDERNNMPAFECLVNTTAEVVISENIDLIYRRETDPETTFDELYIY